MFNLKSCDWSSANGIEDGGVSYHVKALHEEPFLTDEACDLINLEWKRSHVARLRSIGSSSENFPISLVLVRNIGEPKVVGHCKISKISLSETKVFVETVVIHPELRGKGLGKFLMSECEKVCKSKNIEWIYLSTQGQEIFYEKLGYVKCPPVSIYGCQSTNLNESDNQTPGNIKDQENKKPMNNLGNNVSSSTQPTPPPPPPPPFPSPQSSFYNSSSTKTYMRKEIL